MVKNLDFCRFHGGFHLFSFFTKIKVYLKGEREGMSPFKVVDPLYIWVQD